VCSHGCVCVYLRHMLTASACRYTELYVELEVHDVPVLHYVLFALLGHLACSLATVLPA